MLLVVIAACSSVDPAAVHPAGPNDGTPSSPMNVVDVGTLPASWSMAAGYHSPKFLGAEDLDGDGVLDARVTVEGDAGPGLMLLVAGPLVGTKTLPGDEFASLEGFSCPVADVDRDGVKDFACGETYVPGPLEGALTVEDAVPAPPVDSAYDLDQDGFDDRYDLDGDGHDDLERWDYAREGEPRHLTWYGPDLDPERAPDRTLTFSCPSLGAYEAALGWFDDHRVRFWPDLTGDGIPDGTAPGFRDAPDCQNLFFQVPRTGSIDIHSDAATVVGVTSVTEIVPGLPGFDVVPDQTGDGLADVYVRDEGVIVASPVSLRPGAPISGTVVGTVDPVLTLLRPQDLDFDGDGIADFLALGEGAPEWAGVDGTWDPGDFVGDALVVIVRGGGGLDERTYDTVFDFGHTPHDWLPFLEAAMPGFRPSSAMGSCSSISALRLG